jgi:murein L,D-transpeptidase YcbB/YkuD
MSLKAKGWLLLALAGCAGCLGPRERVLPRGNPALDAYIRPKIRLAEGRTLIAVEGILLPAAPGLGDFYARRRDHLVWSSTSGPRPAAYQLLQVLREPASEGLPQAPYHLEAIEAALSGWQRGGGNRRALVRLAELDLLLTSAFLRRADQLQGGRVRPEECHWTGGQYTDPGLLLDSALAADQVQNTLERLRPAHPEYRRLVQGLAAYRRIQAAGGWRALPPGNTPRKGQQGPAEQALRQRLVAGGDLDSLAGGTGFDEPVERALRRFQRRHTLGATGKADVATLAALDIPVERRIAQLEMNLERWRWLPLGPEARYVLVRLDDYALELVEGGQVRLGMKVIAGKAQWRTPIFNSALTQLVFNPYWNVPPAIAREEVLPAVRNDPAYLEERGFMVVSGLGEAARVVGPDTLDWSAPDEEWPYTFIQAPGPDNPLGRLKFLLPNEHSIYLHDTPNRELFSREVRDFSHGCIRLEKSFELAVELLADTPGWTRARIREALQSGQTKQVALEHPVPIFFSYWTAWADEEGAVGFRPDLYGLDARLQEE